MASDQVEIELESKIDSLPVIGEFIENSLERFQADPATIYKVQLAVDEACTNVINYAYSGGVGPLKIVLQLVNKDIVITILDRGKPFDPTLVPPPDLNADVEERKIGGLGIYFIQKLMDSVSYSFDPQEGNILTLKKKLSASAGIDAD